MKASKHTPGPWKIKRFAHHPDFSHGAITIMPDIACLQVPEMDTASEANASLIAASPELLAALERSLERLNSANAARTDKQGRFMVSDIEAAIAKAKGD